ncbi:hypothetical protein AB1Y20_020512 [Prymnesium parvum]|uniref:Glutamate decarboxylase n=1 Tax=Prymnesium parvum TaxID=97485 RepID=A0AB34JXS6_PRYPA
MRARLLTLSLLAVPAVVCAWRVARRRRMARRRPHAADQSQSATTLDPMDRESWELLRASAHRLLDAAINRLQAAKEGRVWTPVPESTKRSLCAPLPHSGLAYGELCSRLEALMPYGVGNTHPRFFGWVHGSGSPGGVLAEIVAAAMNANCGGREHAAIHVEKQVLAWVRAIMGFPSSCGALLTSGTSMATVIALKAARDQRLGFEQSRTSGVAHAQVQCGPLVGYVAEGGHSCIKRAFDLLGIGTAQLRVVPVKADFCMDLRALRRMVELDRQSGLTPFVVIGTAGSVNVGAVDDLCGIADIAQDNHLWFHVDGAFGAAAILSVDARPLLRGLSRASSLAFDFHKWLHVNYDCGCVLVRDHEAHIRAFSERPDYLAASERGIAAGSPWPVDYGPELSRGFRALKVWAHMQEHGVDKLGAAISENMFHARYLAEKIDAAPELQRLAPVTLQIVVFRYVAAKGLDLDELNETLVVELQERGIAAPSTTRINGLLSIRVNITNHRTRIEDLDLLVTEVRSIGAELATSRVGKTV